MSFRSPVLLAALVGLAACGENTTNAFDAGSTAPASDGGSCAGSVSWSTYPGCNGTSLEDKLKCIPSLTVSKAADSGIRGYERYDLVLEQPVDHERPDAGSFGQRLTLFHTDADKPMVLYTTGYFLGGARSELTRTFGANQLTYEHRYFGTSRPASIDYQTLNIRQAAGDAHRIADALHWLYPGKWVNTGASKGGMTSVYHRRFYPCDVDATVAYVAPITNGVSDSAYTPFLDSVGGTRYAQCRADLVAFQKRLLAKRANLVPLITGQFTLLSKDKAFEFAVLELYFAFWQYVPPTDAMYGCSAIPPEGASEGAMFEYLDAINPVADLGSDEALEAFRPYIYQGVTELGAPEPYEKNLTGLLAYPGADLPNAYLPPELSTATFNPAAMADVSEWLASAGTRMMFVYGQFDPWSARPFMVGNATDSVTLWVAGGNHGARIGLLSAADKTAAIERLTRWLGAPVVTRPMFAPEPIEPDERRVPR